MGVISYRTQILLVSFYMPSAKERLIEEDQLLEAIMEEEQVARNRRAHCSHVL